MRIFSAYNKYDRALGLLLIALFSGNMGGILLLPRTISILFLPLLVNTQTNIALIKAPKRLLFIWIIWAAISLAWTPDIDEGIQQLLLLAFNFIYAYEIIAFSLYGNKPLWTIALGWLIALSINNLIGVWEISTDNHLSVSKFGSEHRLMVEGTSIIMRYANGFFSNYNTFVTFICCALPFVYYLFFNTDSKIIKAIVAINLLVSIYILFMNGSRGGVLALAIISIVSLSRLIRGESNIKKVLGLFSILGAFVFISWDSLSYIVVGRQSEINSIEEEARFSVWENCFEVLRDTYFIGTGTGGMFDSMARVAHAGAVLAPHNAFLEILIQYGIFVFSLFILLIKDIYISMKRNTDPSLKALIFSALLAMPLIFVINSINLINPFFWAFIISLFIYANFQQTEY